MNTPAHIVEIFLQPGEVYFGGKETRIRTLLGSCVAIVMWHPGKLVGGMCHYMLPSRPAKIGQQLDGRYADEAVELMLSEIRKAGTRPHEYEVKMFGGGHMFSAHQAAGADHVGARNVEMARLLMNKHGFRISAEHQGGIGHRNIFIEIWNGHVWARHRPPANEEMNGMLCTPSRY